MININKPNQNHQQYKHQLKDKQNTHNKNSMFSGVWFQQNYLLRYFNPFYKLYGEYFETESFIYSIGNTCENREKFNKIRNLMNAV